MNVLSELASYAETHAALRAGRGSTDDVMAFIDWFRAAEQLAEGDVTEPRQTDKAQMPGDDSPDDGPKTDPIPLESGDEGERKENDQ